jgi:hypothetical protein
MPFRTNAAMKNGSETIRHGAGMFSGSGVLHGLA